MSKGVEFMSSKVSWRQLEYLMCFTKIWAFLQLSFWGPAAAFLEFNRDLVSITAPDWDLPTLPLSSVGCWQTVLSLSVYGTNLFTYWLFFLTFLSLDITKKCPKWITWCVQNCIGTKCCKFIIGCVCPEELGWLCHCNLGLFGAI